MGGFMKGKGKGKVIADLDSQKFKKWAQLVKLKTTQNIVRTD